MSVINDMLRDLEQRKAPDRSELETVSANGSLIEEKSSTVKKYLIALAVLLLAVGVGVGGLLLRDSDIMMTPESDPERLTNVGSAETKLEPASRQLTLKKPSVAQVVKPNVVAEGIVEKKQTKAATIQVKAPISKAKASKPKIAAAKPHITNIQQSDVIDKKASMGKVITRANTTSKPKTLSTKPIVRRKSVVSPQKRDQNMADLSRKLFKAGESRKAYRSLYEFMATQAVDQESRTVLISYLLQDERIAEAGDVLVTTQVDHSPELRQLKARWYVAQGEHNLALYTLRERLPELHSYPEYYALLAAYYQRFGFSAKAAETYAHLLEYDNESANWWAGLAIALDSSKQYKDAVNAYKQALEMPDLSPELFEYIENRLSLLAVAGT